MAWRIDNCLEDDSSQGQRTVSAFAQKTKAAPVGAAFDLCAEHVRQLGGGSPLSNLVEVKD